MTELALYVVLSVVGIPCFFFAICRAIEGEAEAIERRRQEKRARATVDDWEPNW